MEVRHRGLPHLPVDWNKMIPEIIEDTMYVYFWKVECDTTEEDGNDGIAFDPMVKIGITHDWVKRHKSLLAQLDKGKWPDWLEMGSITHSTLLGVIEGGRNMEKYLHERFKNKAVGNEFFWYDEQMAEEIDGILDEYCECVLHQIWDSYVTKYG
jgi:hypothetical protein